MPTPLDPINAAFFLCNAPRSVIVGPIGSGKTFTACMRLARHAYEQIPCEDGVRRSRFAIIRNTKPQLRDTTLKTWLEQFPEKEYGAYAWTDNDHIWDFTPKGQPYRVHAEFMFRALEDEQDVRNLLSLEVTGFYFNEIREIDRSILAHAGQRAGRYQPKGFRGNAWQGWLGDTNPWHTEHYLHDLFVTNPDSKHILFRQPSGFDEKAENLNNLRQTVETMALPFNHPERLKQGRTYYEDGVRGFTKEEADVYLRAKWGAIRRGKPIYTAYNDAVHCKPFELDPMIPLRIGMDFGRTPAAVIAQRGPFGWRVRKELCAFDMGVVPFARELKKFLATEFKGYEVGSITGDPSGEAKDHEDRTVFQLLAAQGLKADPASTNEPSVRFNAVNEAFSRLEGGEPALLIHPDCKMLQKACIDGYHYRKLSISGDRYEEHPNKNEYSHCFAAGTPVATPDGAVPIERLRIGDLVLTPVGPRPVTATMSREAETISVTHRKRTVVCTPDHRFWTRAGYVRADALQYSHLPVMRGDAWMSAAFALLPARLPLASRLEWMARLASVASVASRFASIVTRRKPVAPSIAPESVQRVYDITVADAHVFYANDFLVSNCAEALQYLLLGGGEGRALLRNPTRRPQAMQAITEYSTFG
jgi:hypothetical protein